MFLRSARGGTCSLSTKKCVKAYRKKEDVKLRCLHTIDNFPAPHSDMKYKKPKPT